MGIGVKQSTVGVPSSGVTGGAHAGNGSAGSAGSWLVRKSINEEYTVSGKLTKMDYAFYIIA